MVTKTIIYREKKEKVWKTAEMNFSCLCYLKIKRRLHIIRAVRFSCITKSFAGHHSAMTGSGTFLAGRAEMQRAEVKCLAHTPNPLQDLGTELPCFSHPQRAKLIFFSLDYYFLFWIKENKCKRERKLVTHCSFFAETQLPLSQEHDS